ncbi:DNA/RNA non-specific endonuclease [Flavobacterium sp. FPG59]|jgi:endonuclease G|uniref:DNA/RNA non-specific endonuclease n=1 Tax=Flavobacterium sp. FPG59 TaxID=1929267 RepID=UPI000B75B5F4|nr:DNA/RNA non-specific endonuclease [Flavobacterium sp. FPG59]OUD35566.1 endonuclease [Flavobacterium sp. FPG59]
MRFNSSRIVVGCFVIITTLSSCKKEMSNTQNGFVPIANEESEYEKRSKSEDVNQTELRYTTNDLLPISTTNTIVKHNYYSLSYNENYEQAEWVAYELKKDYIKNNNFKRPYFIEDAKVITGSADWRNYKNSNYDKGHLCPAGDMEFSMSAYNDTFLTSNIAPQDKKFNNGIWNRLEQKVRYWAVKENGVYVVTGGVLNNSLKTIGKEKVAVPQYFYKILMNRSGNRVKMIGFLMSNQPSDEPLYKFVVSVDAIEKLTGINFFPQLEDRLENQLEANKDYKYWSFN